MLVWNKCTKSNVSYLTGVLKSFVFDLADLWIVTNLVRIDFFYQMGLVFYWYDNTEITKNRHPCTLSKLSFNRLSVLIFDNLATRHAICNFFYTSTFSIFWKFTPTKRVNRDSLNLKPYIFGFFIHLIGTISQFSYISAHFTNFQWVNFVWYYQKLNHITSIGPKIHPQSELLPEW